MPYQSSGRIGDLLLRRGQIRANAELGRGEAWASGIQNIAGIAAQTIGDLARIKAEAPQREAEQIRLTSMRRAEAERQRELRDQSTLRGVKTMFTDPVTGQTDDDAVVKELRKAQRFDMADIYAEDTRRRREGFADEAVGRIGELRTPLGQAQQLYGEITKQPDLYPRLRPKLMELASQVHPDLATAIPETYDPEHLKQATDFLTSTMTTLEKQERAFKAFKAANERNASVEQRNKGHREALGNALVSATTPEAHAQVLALARSGGVPEEMIAPFAKWTPDLPQRADEQLLMTPKERREARESKPGHMAGTSALALTYNKLYDQEEARLGRAPNVSEQDRILTKARTPIQVQTPEKPLSAADQLKVKAILTKPSEYAKLDSDTRSRLIGELYKQGFQFPDDDSRQEALDRFNFGIYRDEHTRYYATAGVYGSPTTRPPAMSYTAWKQKGKPDFAPPGAATPPQQPFPTTPRIVAPTGPQDGTQQPIPGIPGGVAEYRNGRWIRVK